MKKLLAAIIAAALLLSGCSLSSRPAVSAPPAETPSPSPTPIVTPTPAPEPSDDELVLVRDYIPGIFIDLKYATTDNFTGQVIYDSDEAYLRYGTVKKLLAAQNELSGRGLSLKIWDAYRPVSAQFKLWEICPNPVYVSDPNNGYSKHSRANTVDITLVTSTGESIPITATFPPRQQKMHVSLKASWSKTALSPIRANGGTIPTASAMMCTNDNSI